ncbi:MAG: site-specific integrase [Acidobacteria bacterium]|nr:site-specific integrase [Acidobacteriota bacterium]
MRGSIRRRYKGSWSLILDLGYATDPETGRQKRKQKWVTFRGTKKDAEKELTRLLNASDTGVFVEPSKLTLLTWLESWLRLTVEPTARPATLVRYQGIVANHVAKATIGSIPLQKLRASHFEAYYATIPAGSRPVHHTVLHRALRKAVKERVLLVNPADDLDHAPRRDRGRDEDAAKHCWSVIEAQTFLAAVKAAGGQAGAFYALALDTGARKGELCGLRWSDLDLEAGTLRIVQQLTRPGPEPVFGPPKGGRARTVSIAAGTVELLKAHRKAQAELKMRNRTTYKDLGLIFAKEYGDLTNRADMIGLPLQANHLGARQFDKLITAAKVPRITFHGCRHTCATLLLQAGEPVHVVSQRLGHSDPTITMRVYAHVLPDMQKQAAATMGAILHG